MALVVFGEFFAPLFVVIGLGTRIFAIPIIYTIIVIVFDVHWEDSFGKMEKGLNIFSLLCIDISCGTR